MTRASHWALVTLIACVRSWSGDSLVINNEGEGAQKIEPFFNHKPYFWGVPATTTIFQVRDSLPSRSSSDNVIQLQTVSRIATYQYQQAALSHIMLLHEDIGLAYTALWPITLKNLVKQANEILPNWHYIKLHWQVASNRSVLDTEHYERWWRSSRRQLGKISPRGRALLHKNWHDWSSRSLPVLRVDSERSFNSKAILFSPEGLKQVRSLGGGLRARSAKLPIKGLLTTPILLGPREIGDKGRGGEQIAQWLLEARELAILNGPLPSSLRFNRKNNLDGNAVTTAADVSIWLEYEQRRYRPGHTIPQNTTIPFCDKPLTDWSPVQLTWPPLK